MTNEEVIEYVKTLDWYKEQIKEPTTEMIFLAGSRSFGTDILESDYDIIVYSSKADNEIINHNAPIPNDLHLNMHYMYYSKDFLYGALTFNKDYPSNFWIISGLITPIQKYKMIFKKENSVYYSFLDTNAAAITQLGIASLLEHQWDELIYLSQHPNEFNSFDRKTLYYLILGYQNLIQSYDMNELKQIRLHQIKPEQIKHIQESLKYLIDFYNQIDYNDYIILYTKLEMIMNGN